MFNKEFKARGIIIGYRRSGAKQYNSQVLVRVYLDPNFVPDIIGSRVIVRDLHGNLYKGKVIRIHNKKNSTIIVRFNPNIPGQLIGYFVDIV